MAKTFLVAIEDDSPVGATSTASGHEFDSVIFNLTYIAMRDPNLLVDILATLKSAKKLENKPLIKERSPEMLIALERFQRLFKINII